MLFPYETITDPVERTRKLVFAYQHVLWPAFFLIQNDIRRKLAAEFILSAPSKPDQLRSLPSSDDSNKIIARFLGLAQARRVSFDSFDLPTKPNPVSLIDSYKKYALKKIAKGSKLPELMGAKINNYNTEKLLDYFEEGIDNDDLIILTLASSIMREEPFRVFIEINFLGFSQPWELADEMGVAERQIKRHYHQNLKLLRGIINEHFPDLSEHPSLTTQKTSLTFAEMAGASPDITKMHLEQNLSLKELYLTAEGLMDSDTGAISTAEMFSLCGICFYNASNKMTTEEVARATGNTAKSISTYLMNARSKMAKALAGTELKDTPILRRRLHDTSVLNDHDRKLYSIDTSNIDFRSPHGFRLFHLSDTLFSPRMHNACTRYFLEDFSKPRDRQQLVLDLNTTHQGLRRITSEIIKILEDAARIEDPDLLEHICFDRVKFGTYLQRGKDPYSNMDATTPPAPASTPEHP